MAKEGVGVLLVEQNVALLEQGKAVLEGPASSLAQDPRVREAYLSL